MHLLKSIAKPKRKTFPMPNTGTVMDISAGEYIKGHKGQEVLNGGFALFFAIAALPNMFKTTTSAGMAAITFLGFPKAGMHAHDSETTMVEGRIESLILNAMRIYKDLDIRIPESLSAEGRLMFTSQVDYNATELFGMLKKWATSRIKEEATIKCEIIDEATGKPMEWWSPLISFWDSLSGMNPQSAEDMVATGEVGTSDLNMLAMRVNSGKSQIVDQLGSFTARHAMYIIATVHVGQTYQLDPRKPNVRTLRFMRDNVKLKRVPENLSFSTGNCYVITKMQPMLTNGAPEFPYTPKDPNSGTDLIELRFTNMRGKYGPSDIPHAIIVSQRDGWLPYMSNYIYLKDNERYGFVGNLQNYTLALCPEIKLQRTTLREKFRNHITLQIAAYHLVNLHWMHQRWDEDKLPVKYHCEPTQLYEDIKALGYDWELLLKTRFWHGEVVEGAEHVPFISTFDLLKIRLGEYHPYWYPVKQKDLLAEKSKEIK